MNGKRWMTWQRAWTRRNASAAAFQERRAARPLGSVRWSRGYRLELCLLAASLLASLRCANLLAQSGAAVAVLPAATTQAKSTATIPARLAAFPLTAGGESSSIATPYVVAWLTAMVHDNLPPTYADDRKWGQQKEVWDGVKIWREGGRLETKRKTKTVNTGTWTRYRLTIVDPEQNVHIEFHRLETLPDGRIAFEVSVECLLDVFGRLSQWARDVQLLSISAQADAACRLTLAGTVKFQLNMLKLPPDVAIKPHVDVAHVELTHYRVRRVSQVGGDFAKYLGQGLRSVVDEKLEDMNAKLVGKINAQLEKHSPRLEFSTEDWLRSKFPLPGAP
ncbi:MAG: hypothetical protein KDA45_11335 [Planctomycetales bacterium]|nr:hypothetical protein [Planctomycetales bacterium]